MNAECCGEQGETLIFTCAGAAYAGQVANQAGVKLMKDGTAKLFCAAAVAAEISEKVERTKNAQLRVGIDGCDDHCVRKIMEKCNVPLDLHVVVTDLDIEKQPTDPHMLVNTNRVVQKVGRRIARGL